MGEIALDGSDFFFQAEDGIRDGTVTGVQTCALPIYCACCLWIKRRDRTKRESAPPLPGKGTRPLPRQPLPVAKETKKCQASARSKMSGICPAVHNYVANTPSTNEVPETERFGLATHSTSLAHRWRLGVGALAP